MTVSASGRASTRDRAGFHAEGGPREDREGDAVRCASAQEPHPYRRIRVHGGALRLAVKDWRVRFHVEGRRIAVES
jgi:hypothetical protein